MRGFFYFTYIRFAFAAHSKNPRCAPTRSPHYLLSATHFLFSILPTIHPYRVLPLPTLQFALPTFLSPFPVACTPLTSPDKPDTAYAPAQTRATAGTQN